MLAALLLNPVLGRQSSAGSGRRKQWWEGEWIIPGVTHYLPEKPPEDIVPLRPKIKGLRKRATSSNDKRQLAGLTRSLTWLERRARAVDEERAIRDITERYRALNLKMQRFEERLKANEDDEDFLVILQIAVD